VTGGFPCSWDVKGRGIWQHEASAFGVESEGR
jgi:hypothetical protein